MTDYQREILAIDNRHLTIYKMEEEFHNTGF